MGRGKNTNDEVVGHKVIGTINSRRWEIYTKLTDRSAAAKEAATKWGLLGAKAYPLYKD
jgi:hypothetical protein